MINRLKTLSIVFSTLFLVYSCNKEQLLEKEEVNVSKTKHATPELVENVVQNIQIPSKQLNSLSLEPSPSVAAFNTISDVSGDYTTTTKLISLSYLSDCALVNSITDGTLTVSFSSAMKRDKVVQIENYSPCRWLAYWGNYPDVENNAPLILFSVGQTSMTLTLSKPVNTLGFELNSNSTYMTQPSYKVDFYNGSTLVGSITRSVRPSITTPTNTSKLFAASTGSSFDKVIVALVSGSASGFAISQIRYTKSIPIDIKPLTCPNTINVKTPGLVPVAILGTANFDVNDLDLTTINLNGVSPIASQMKFADVAAPYTKADDFDCAITAPDTYMDLNLKFDNQALVRSLANLNNGQQVVLSLTGKTKSGVDIRGKDFILIVNNEKTR